MQFARHGIPVICVSDNGPQFAAHDYKKFSKQWKLELVTTSPRYPKSNEKVENAVGAAKRLMTKTKNSFDAYLALLDYRNTPTQGLNASPAQRLISRWAKTLLSTTKNLLVPEVTLGQHQKIRANKQRLAKYYNKAAHDLPALISGDVAWVNLSPDSLKQEHLRKAQVKAKVGVRSCEVETEDGKRFWRKCVHLRKSLANQRGSRHLAMFQQRRQPPPWSFSPHLLILSLMSPVGLAPIPVTDPLGNSSGLVTTLPNNSPYRTQYGRSSDPSIWEIMSR